MYLRRTNQWKQFLLQEAIEQTGLPLEVVAIIRDLSNELGPVSEKVLTSIGTLLRSYSSATPLIIDWTNPSGDSKFRSTPAISDLQVILYDRRKPRSERTAEYEAFRKKMDEEFIHPLVAGANSWGARNPNYPRLENILDTNRYRKRYVKKLKKAGLTKQAEASDKVFVDAMVKWTEKFAMSDIETIIKAVVEDPDDFQAILKFAEPKREKTKLSAAAVQAKRLLQREPEDPQKVVHKFKDGYYWYDIRSDACTLEGQKMGHCGKGMAGGNLYSLRSPSGTKKDPDPHVTIELTAPGIIYQIKGKGNDAPVKKYWPYISSFIKNVLTDEGNPVTGYMEEKTLPGFSEMYDYLQEQNPLALKEDFADTANRYKVYLAEYAEGLFSNYGMLASSPSPLDKVNAKNISFSSTPPKVYSNTYTVRFTIDYKLKYKAKLPNYFNSRGYPLRRARKEEELDRIRDHIKNKIFPKYFSTGTSDSILPEPSSPKAKYNEGSLSDIYDLHYDLKWEWNIPTGYPGPPESTKKLKDAAKEIKAVLKYLVGIEVDLRSGGKLDPDQKKFLQGKFNKEGGMAKMDIAGFEMEVEKYFDSLGFQPSDDEEMLQESITFDRWAKIIK